MQEFSLVILGDIRKSPLLPGCWEFLGIFLSVFTASAFYGCNLTSAVFGTAGKRKWPTACSKIIGRLRESVELRANLLPTGFYSPYRILLFFSFFFSFYRLVFDLWRATGTHRANQIQPICWPSLEGSVSFSSRSSHFPSTETFACCLFFSCLQHSNAFCFSFCFLGGAGTRWWISLFFFLCFLGSFWLEPVWASAVIQLISHIFINSYEIYCCAASKLNLSQVHFGLTWLKFNRTVNSFYFFSEFRVENRIRAIFFVCGGGGRSYCRRAPPLPHQYPIKTDTLLQLLKSSSRTPSTRQGFSLVRFPLAFPLIFVLLHQVEDQQLDQRRLAPNLDEFYRA